MHLVFRLLLLFGVVFAAFQSHAAELVVLVQPGCPWCRQFDSEIAPAWPKTQEGMRAPLRRVDITEPWPDDLAGIQRERFTPSFILMHEGKEIGRLRGYAGDEFFWFRIAELMEKLPQ
ncbi:transcriptional regulator [Ciceribacter selenitireducens]